MARSPIRDRTLVQMLSLYLILLAFFILLYNMSRTEESRVRTVTGSLQSTFSSRGAPVVRPDALTSLLGDVIDHAALEDKFSRLIKTGVPLARIEVIKPGRLLEARFAAARLFEDDSADLRPDSKELIDRLASLLNEAPAGARFDAEIIMGGDGLAALTDDGKPPLQVARASRLAAALSDAGAPRGGAAGGIDQGAADRVRLLLRVRAKEEPRGAIGLPGRDGAQ